MKSTRPLWFRPLSWFILAVDLFFITVFVVAIPVGAVTGSIDIGLAAGIAAAALLAARPSISYCTATRRYRVRNIFRTHWVPLEELPRALRSAREGAPEGFESLPAPVAILSVFTVWTGERIVSIHASAGADVVSLSVDRLFERPDA